MAYGDSEWSSRDERNTGLNREIANVKPSRWAARDVAKLCNLFPDSRALVMAESEVLGRMVEELIHSAAELGQAAVYRPSSWEIKFANGATIHLVRMGDHGRLNGLRYDVAWVRGSMDYALHNTVAMGLNLDIPSRFLWED